MPNTIGEIFVVNGEDWVVVEIVAERVRVAPANDLENTGWLEEVIDPE